MEKSTAQSGCLPWCRLGVFVFNCCRGGCAWYLYYGKATAARGAAANGKGRWQKWCGAQGLTKKNLAVQPNLVQNKNIVHAGPVTVPRMQAV